jgi:hypothetical protein
MEMRRTALSCLLGGLCLAAGLMTGLPLRPAMAQKGEAPPKTFDLRTVRVGDMFQAVRFRPATGESWRITNNRWERIAESGPVPAGDYDIVLVATETDYTALRFDRKTGAGWQLRDRRWIKVEEPDPPK